MSLRVGWNFGSTAEDECQDAVMQEPPCWTATSAVLKAGRELSSWLLSNLSPPSSPLVSSFFCKDPFASRQSPNPSCLSQPAASHTPYPPPTPSLISFLPQELLEEIFREYLHGPTSTSPSPSNPLTGSFRRILAATGTKTTPFTLAHVCSSWRDIVMSNPLLWAKLCALRPEPQDIPVFEFWLSRSSPYPLDLTIVEGRGNQKADLNDTTCQILLSASAHSPRWKAISLQLGRDLEALFVTPSGPTSLQLPSLRGFRLDLVDWSTEGSQCMSRMLSKGPELQSAAWGSACQIPCFFSDTPWAGLHTIQIGHVNLSDLLQILHVATALHTLFIDYLQVDCSVPSPLTGTTYRIELPSLSSLTLLRYDSLVPLFDSLRVPSLSSLALKFGMGSSLAYDAGWRSLAGLVHHSSCRITSLTWSDDLHPEQQFLGKIDDTYASIFFHLHDLRIESPVGKKTVETFSPLGGQCHNLRALRTFELRDCTAEYDSVLAIIACSHLDWVDIKLRDEAGMCRHVGLPQRSASLVS
ncbi:hypothetical protein FA13DRAFT_1167542 [Coprinellus micaceus]|uniref:Uncharacterized protein n=1 Tax=Coprinellus micaceus TaxID=71717 RepID=A0A4Y7SU55_COPMI|nr:hypothetical protein FA13DRAFT_1167542 [Coprinellus micaceus]